MKQHGPCPVCKQTSLAHTGCFWQCTHCSILITETALRREHESRSRKGTCADGKR